MSSVGGIAPASALPSSLLPSPGPLTVADALARLRLQPGSTVEIRDSLTNIRQNLDALQGVAARVTTLVTTDTHATLGVGVEQYRRNAAILERWGAGAGQTVDVTGVSAAGAAGFAAARPDWVESFTVADSSANLSRYLDDLQAQAAAGRLRQIVQTGAAMPLTLTAAQLAADGDALAVIKNGAYTLAVREASVGETLGLDGRSALVANAKVKAVHVKDDTDAIEQNLDALQRAGLRVRSISQTDAGTPLTLTARQLATDAVVIGKILTPYQLDVIRASAAQAAKLAANRKVESISVADTADNIGRRWALLNRLSDSLAAVEVTDPSNAVALTADQLTTGSAVLARFTVDDAHDYRLAVRGARAGQAAGLAAIDRVASVSLTDTADNLAANLGDLKALNAAGQLGAISVSGRGWQLSLDAAQMLGDEATATLGVVGKITSRNVGITVSGATVAQLDDLAAQSRVVAIGLKASSDEIESSLDALAALGRRLAHIEQTDDGTALDLTQTAFVSHAAVLDKVDGGYQVNLSGVKAAKAVLFAMNSRVTGLGVADSGRNLSVYWNALRSIGGTLAGVTRTDDGALSLTAANYLMGRGDGLVAKFSADQRFSVTAASVAEAIELDLDEAVDRIDVLDAGSVVTSRLDALGGLAAGGKLRGIVLAPTTTRLALHASQLEGAQPVLDLVTDGRYTLALDGVAADQLAALLDANRKIARVEVSADAAGIADHLDDLGAAGSRLASIVRTDDAAAALSLSVEQFEAHRATLAKIAGGYDAELTGVSATRAAALAQLAPVKSLQVADTGAAIGAAWHNLLALDGKLGGLAQTDSAPIGLTASQWATGRALGDRFSSPLAVAISGATADDLAALEADDAVQSIAVDDSADAVAAAWSDLAASTKLGRVRITDPATALALTADAYASSTALRGLIEGSYGLALSGAAVADAATLQADAHVESFDVTGTSGDIAAGFDTLADLGKLTGLALDDDGGTLALSAAQVLAHGDTLAKINGNYRIAAGSAAVSDLGELVTVDNLASVAVRDSAARIADGLDDLAALGGLLGGIELSDDSPVLALAHADWSAAGATLARITSPYQVDLSQVSPASVAAAAADGTVREISVAGSAAAVSLDWSALLSAWNGGNGKLAAIALTDDAALGLTEAQQSDGAAMIAALLADRPIVTTP